MFIEPGLENPPHQPRWAGAALGSNKTVTRSTLDGTGASKHVVWVTPQLHVDRLGNLPEHDPGPTAIAWQATVVVIQQRHAAVPLSQGVRIRLTSSKARRGSPATLPVALLQPLEGTARGGVQLATGSDLAPATGVWLSIRVRR